MFSFGIGDCHIAVYPDAKLTTQDIDLIWLQHPEVRRDGIEPGASA